MKRRHTAGIHEGLRDIRRIIAEMVERRDATRDEFAGLIQKAMKEKVENLDDAVQLLTKVGITKTFAKKAMYGVTGDLTVWNLLDAVTRKSQTLNAGERTEVDRKASSLLTIA